jgi:UDP-3-O-acyl-N-acetylglucosamine deacetylase
MLNYLFGQKYVQDKITFHLRPAMLKSTKVWQRYEAKQEKKFTFTTVSIEFVHTATASSATAGSTTLAVPHLINHISTKQNDNNFIFIGQLEPLFSFKIRPKPWPYLLVL